MSAESHSHAGARRLPALIAAACLLAGCGLGAGTPAAQVSVEVTRDFGAQAIRSLPRPHQQGQETVMSLLMRNATVTTRYGGGFVESIDGHSGGHQGGQPFDWFYFINGVLAAQGAAQANVHAGERIWWDLHDWSQTDEVPAVIGSFPQPLQDGVEGRRQPVQLECAPGERVACQLAAAHLRAARIRFTQTALRSRPHAQHALRVLVGSVTQLHAERPVQVLASGPASSGVYARLTSSPAALALLDPQGAVVRTLTAGAGLIAADRPSGEEPVWLITGTDPAGVVLAARALDERNLHDRFALALSGSNLLSVPRPSP